MLVQSDHYRRNATAFREDHSAGFKQLEFGTVVSIDAASFTAGVRLDNSSDLLGVSLLLTKYSHKGRIVDNGEINYTAKATSKVSLPEIGSRVIVAFVRGKISKPIILGCFKDPFIPVNNSNNQVYDDLEVHQSQYSKKIDTEGNYEEYFPDGTTLSVSDVVTGNTTALSEEATVDTSLIKSSKTFRIKHSTGTCIKIDSDGNVDIDTSAVSGGKVSIISDKVVIGTDAADVLVILQETLKLLSTAVCAAPGSPIVFIPTIPLGNTLTSLITKIGTLIPTV